MNKSNHVNFEVIEVWYNSIYEPYTYKPTTKQSERHYAIKIGNDVFLLGQENYGIYICDEQNI